MKRSLAFLAGGCLLLGSCDNKSGKASSVQDSSFTVNATGDTVLLTAPQKPALSVADSAKQLQDKDTAAKMIENAPASVSIHLDSIPEQK